MGVIKEGVLTEAVSIIRTLHVLYMFGRIFSLYMYLVYTCTVHDMDLLNLFRW